MKTTQVGIILKRLLPRKHKISVLTKNHGKIFLVALPTTICNKLWPGMIIGFETTEKFYNFALAKKIDILASHTKLSQNNIVLLHQLLEIIYYSAPLNSPCIDLFNFTLTMITLIDKNAFFKTNTDIKSDLFLLKLLLILGLYPSNNTESFSKLVSDLSLFSIDFSDQQKVESLLAQLSNSQEMVKKIKKIKLDCLKNHPCYNAFKTLNVQI